MDGRVETGKGGFDWLGDLTTAAFVELQAEQDKQPGATEQDCLARWAAARWVFRVGWREFGAGLPCDMRGAARAAAMRAARSLPGRGRDYLRRVNGGCVRGVRL